MAEFTFEVTRSVSIEEVRRRLATAYNLILSWPDPPERETASSENFGEHTEPAVENAPTKESDANEV